VAHPTVQVSDIRPVLEGAVPQRQIQSGSAATTSVRSLDALEREAIVSALDHFEGNRTAAATALGISVRKLQYKIKEYQQAGMRIQ
jgi:DNA-binding NtrC family response regulator